MIKSLHAISERRRRLSMSKPEIGFDTYISLAIIQMKKMFALKGVLFGVTAHWLVRVYLLRSIWITVLSDDPTRLGSLDSSALTTYIVLSTLHSSLLTPLVAILIANRIKSGDIIFQLVRPSHPLTVIIAEALGRDIAKALPTICILLLLTPVLGFQLTSSLGLFLKYVMLGLMGLLINFLIYLALGLLAFRTIRTDGVLQLFAVVQGLLTGALFPLILLPVELQSVVRWTPFAMLVDIPISAYLGLPLPGTILHIILIGICWLIILIIVIRYLWLSTKANIQIFGG